MTQWRQVERLGPSGIPFTCWEPTDEPDPSTADITITLDGRHSELLNTEAQRLGQDRAALAKFLLEHAIRERVYRENNCRCGTAIPGAV